MCFSKVVYRYSMLNQSEDNNFDEEIERTLTGGSHPHPMFGDASDEEVRELSWFELAWASLFGNRDYVSVCSVCQWLSVL